MSRDSGRERSNEPPPGKLSCGVVIARRDGERWLTLLLRAYHHWDFPKGLCEVGETPLATAVREVREETGIADLDFIWSERHFETGPYSRGKTARYYIAESQTGDVVLGPSPDTGEPEHHEWRWVSFDEAYDLTAPRVRDVVRWARQIIGT